MSDEGSNARLEEVRARAVGTLVELLGIEVVDVSGDGRRVVCRLSVRPEHLAPNGYLHGGAVTALADTACGLGAHEARPAAAYGHTTVELKCNLLGTVRDGAVRCEATAVHAGRTTQVWDAVVTDEATGKVTALFRCTQLLLYR